MRLDSTLGLKDDCWFQKPRIVLTIFYPPPLAHVITNFYVWVLSRTGIPIILPIVFIDRVLLKYFQVQSNNFTLINYLLVYHMKLCSHFYHVLINTTLLPSRMDCAWYFWIVWLFLDQLFSLLGMVLSIFARKIVDYLEYWTRRFGFHEAIFSRAHFIGTIRILLGFWWSGTRKQSVIFFNISM